MDTSDVLWIETPDGHPTRTAGVTVFPYRARASLNPYYGCSLGCAYCVLLADGLPEPERVRSVATVEAILDAVEAHRDALGDLTFHVGDHSDPFLPETERATAEIVEGLAQRRFRNQVSLTSKVCPSRETLARIAAVQGPAVTVYASLADASGRIEKVSGSTRVALARLAHEVGLHTVLLLRPVSPAWTSLEQLAPLLRALRGSVSEVVITGLRMSDPVAEALVRRGVTPPAGGTSGEAYIDPGFLARLAALVDHELPGVTLSQKRSCASNRHHRRDCTKKGAHPWDPSVPGHTPPSPASPLQVLHDGHGYCRTLPPASSPSPFPEPVHRALTELVARLGAPPAIPFRLTGGALAVLEGTRTECNDLDVVVQRSDFERLLQRFHAEDVRVQKCGPGCDISPNATIAPLRARTLSHEGLCARAAFTVQGIAVDVTDEASAPSPLALVPVGELRVLCEDRLGRWASLQPAVEPNELLGVDRLLRHKRNAQLARRN